MRVLVLALSLVAATAAQAQRPGPASFRVYEKGVLVGTVEMTLESSAEGWRLQGSSRVEGANGISVPRLDLHYDGEWRGRFMSMEMAAPEDQLLHVAVLGATTRTDIIRAGRVRFRANSISPDTIFLPEYALGAYEAVAARLAGARPGTELPLFVAPDAEIRALVERVTTERVRTADGTLEATRYHLTELRGGPVAVEVWVDRGRLLRLDVPRWHLTMLRDDLR
jgi:hypothetical protein